jgi:hypothetical protein
MAFRRPDPYGVLNAINNFSISDTSIVKLEDGNACVELEFMSLYALLLSAN